jgi:hypothetical protein
MAGAGVNQVRALIALESFAGVSYQHEEFPVRQAAVASSGRFRL